MTHKTGIETVIHDNKLYEGQPSKFPNYKIVIGDDEFSYFSNGNPPCKQGDNVSLHYYTDKKGRYIVSTDYETKVHKFQILPENLTPTDDIPLPDDDLSNFEPDHFASNGVVDTNPTNFEYGANAKPAYKPMVDKKGLEMFCMAMAKSALESSQLKAEKEPIAKFMQDMITVYRESFNK